MARKFSFQLLAMSHVVQKYAFFVLQDYLTNDALAWQLSFTHAASILNTWEGIQRILPVFILYSAEQFVGHNTMAVITTLANCLGVAFIAMSTPPVLANVTGSCGVHDLECIGQTQKNLFYIGLALVAVGVAGRKVIPKENGEDEQEQSLGRYILEKLVLITAPRILAQILPNIGKWPLRFGVPAICTAVATFFFLIGLKNKLEQTDSTAVTIVPQEVENQQRVQSTPSPRTLEEAAIISSRGTGYQDEDNTSRKLSAVLRMAWWLLPLWLPCAICGIVVSNGNTYFVQQAAHLRTPSRHITVSAILLYIELNTLLCKLIKKWTSRYQRKLATDMVKGRVTSTPMLTIPSVMVLAIICCVTAMKIEERRLRAVGRQNSFENPDGPIDMSIFWMLLPYWFLTAVDAGLEVEIAELIEDEVPSSAGKYAGLFARAVLGCGFLLSVLLVYIVGQVHPDWFEHTLNMSRLDKYYCVLLGLNSVNLVVYSVVACACGCGQTAQTSPDA